MNQASEIDSVRQTAILSSMAGFPFRLVFAFAKKATTGLCATRCCRPAL
jgi:hypothetical protein